MKAAYSAASPEGGIPLGDRELEASFLTKPGRAHPFLTLGDYFRALNRFISDLVDRNAIPGVSGEPERLAIRSEKHGAFAHIASIEIVSGERRVNLCTAAALSGGGGEALEREYQTLLRLASSPGSPYLPHPIGLEEISLGPGGRENLTVLLTDWFEGFHEWHLHPGAPGSPPGVLVWDHTSGHRRAEAAEIERLFEEAARILTLCYEPETFDQITMWHHAAGDFIIRSTPDASEVRLCTARDFAPLPGIGAAETTAPVALVYFLLNTVLRMRLDKRDGVGEAVWAGEGVVRPSVAGFFKGIRSTGAASRAGVGNPEDLLDLLRSFTPEELEGLHGPLLSLYPEGDPMETDLMEENLPEHSFTLWRVLREARVSRPPEGW